MKPKWHQLYSAKSNSPQGEILLSFYIFDQKQEHKFMYRNINPVPETKPYTFEINILGLRDLKPLAMLPIKKAYIKFDMNSLNVSGEPENNLPSINLPKKEIFLPQLQCQVFDYIFSGMFNPTLGVFLLNLKRLIAQTEAQIKEDTEKSKEKLAFYFSTGIVKGALGNLGKIDKLFDKENNNEITINTSETSNDINIINTAFNKNQNKILINEDEENKTSEELEKLKTKAEITITTKHYNADFIEKNKDIPEYFALLPQYKTYFIPGSERHRGNKTGYQIEDLSLSPSQDYYMPIGYIPKYDHSKEKENEQKEQDNSGKIYNIKKHYRRYYRTNLEQVK